MHPLQNTVTRQKVKTPFNIQTTTLNKYRKDANGNNPKVIPSAIRFKQPGHNFSNHAKIFSYRTN